ncbi:MAG TPA: class I SAM-dependent methyltransferase [Gaiellaceae bacterium]|nr:class I SAM-dependent methyltransferase [Gaiellaceae bacterium]
MTEGLRKQYATDDNLQARIALHAAFSTNPHWAEWLFEREAPGRDARILDLGCGPATLWRTNRERIDPSWSLTLTDFSPGMIDAARLELGERAVCVVADAQELPFPADSFDAALANHMLYHVPDRPRAFAEISRVVVSGGAFHASTIGRGHLAELDALVPGWDLGRYAETFGLETGPEQLQPFFADVRVERFEDGLAVTEAEPVLAYIRSSSRYAGEDLCGARKTVEEAIARQGAFTVTKRQGLISGRKP